MIPDFSEYREPMVGGGSVFLAIRNQEPSKSYWINDINRGIYSFWHMCKKDPERLRKEAENFKRTCRNGWELFMSLKHYTPSTILDSALRFYVLNRISFSGLSDSGGFSEESFKKRFTAESLELLRHIGQHLENVKVTNEDYEQLLSAPGSRVFIYLDPPYITNKESKLYGKRGSLHGTFDHERFARNVEECDHKWLISYDRCEQVYKRFSFGYVYEKELPYSMNNVRNGPRNHMGKELFITNFKVRQHDLSDYGLIAV